MSAPASPRPALPPLLGLVAALVAAVPATSDVRLPALFAEHMVVQRDIAVPVWGWAEPGEAVTVTLAERTASATADEQGRWMVRLAPLPAGGPHTLTIAGANTLTVRDVLVGEVWVASGQSNMEMSVGSSLNAEQEMAATWREIRMFTVERASTDEPQADVQGRWVTAEPGRIRHFSAAGYFFARHLHRVLGVPVGIIHASWGGTAAQGWTPPAAMEGQPELEIIARHREQQREEYERQVRLYPLKLGSWERMRDEARAEGRPEPPRPPEPRNPSEDPARLGALYNGMIAPLVPYGIRGAIWYQGEANAGESRLYRSLFPTMIRAWRQAWRQGDFPFLYVQLANFMERRDRPADSGWAGLREAQLLTLSVPNTGMAVAIDIGDAVDIHPKNKQDVGRRLALAAEAVAYGRDVTYSGPVYESMAVEGSRVRLRFRHVDGGLVALAEPPVTVPADPSGGLEVAPRLVPAERLEGFAIAGPEGPFVWAQARIDGDTVVVWSDEVAAPRAVRYAWADNPAANLYNAAGLPASPFRTDAEE